MVSVAKDRRPEECGCDRAEDRRSALVGVGKDAVSANQVRGHYDQGGFHTLLKRSVTDRVATTMDALVSTMARCWCDERKCKIQEGNIKNRERLTGGGSSDSARPEAEARSSTPCIELRTE